MASTAGEGRECVESQPQRALAFCCMVVAERAIGLLRSLFSRASRLIVPHSAILRHLSTKAVHGPYKIPALPCTRFADPMHEVSSLLRLLRDTLQEIRSYERLTVYRVCRRKWVGCCSDSIRWARVHSAGGSASCWEAWCAEAAAYSAGGRSDWAIHCSCE